MCDAAEATQEAVHRQAVTAFADNSAEGGHCSSDNWAVVAVCTVRHCNSVSVGIADSAVFADTVDTADSVVFAGTVDTADSVVFAGIADIDHCIVAVGSVCLIAVHWNIRGGCWAG